MEDKSTIKENKMGVKPIVPLLLSMAVPMMISMLVQAFYNIVDSIFVSKMSEDALTAVSLAFSAQNLMIALGTGTGVGVNALLSKSLGEKNFERANKTAVNSLFLAALCWLVMLLFAVFGVNIYMNALTSSEVIREYGKQYLTLVCGCSIGMYTQVASERILISTGRTIYTMVTQAVGAIINIIMDPILIFGLIGFPKLGVAGAALATVFGQLVSASLAVFFNLKFNNDIKISFKGFRPDGDIIKRIYSVGVPSIVMASIGSFMTYGMNILLDRFSSTAQAVFGVYFKLQSFCFMPVFGLNNGMVPIIAYNYGARKPGRIQKTIWTGLVTAVLIMGIAVLIFEFMPGILLRMFDASEEMLRIGVPALRIIAIHFLLAAFSVVIMSTCQAFGKGLYSMWVSICRQLVVLLPSAWLLSMINLDAVWFSFPIAELISVTMCSIFYKKIKKNIILPMKREVNEGGA